MAEKKLTDTDTAVSKGQYWLEEIAQAEASFDTWVERGERVVDRYRDDRSYKTKTKRQFNILWSNTQVLKPALYGRMPKPEVSRRWDDADPVGKVASTILERSLAYEVEQYSDFNAAMNGAVEDRLLPGRGIAWQRYEMGEVGQEDTGQISEDLRTKLAYECAPCDYVNWKDFLHNPARTWDEVWWVARRVYLTKREGVGRFGEIFNTVPVQDKEKGADKETPKDALKSKTEIWEIWDKNEKTVTWIAKGFRRVLDERPDPLQLEGFFPCPKPLYATTTTGSLVPVPDYCEYQDQAEELDVISQRIHLLTKALKARGVYNAEFKSIKRIFSETEDNELIPVDSWAAFAEKGGLKGAIDWVPLDVIAGVLEKLNIQRQECLNVIYQTMGLSDIMRGATDADETLGAQKLKANFGSMRLRSSQGDVANFATELLRLKAQVMCRFFSPATLIQMSGIEQAPEAKTPEFPQLLEQAMQLLKTGPLRGFRISIESDTLAQIDEQADKEEGAQCLDAMGNILKNAMPLVQAAPPMLHAVGQTLLAVMRKFRLGRSVELAWEQSLQQTQQMMAQPQGIPPEVQEEIQRVQEEQAKKGEELQAQEQELFQRETQHQVEKIQYQADQKVAAAEQKAAQREAEARGHVQEQERQIGDDKLLMQVRELITQHGAAVEKIVQDASTEITIAEAKSEAKSKAEGEKKKEEKEESRAQSVVKQVAELNQTLGKEIGEAIIKSGNKKLLRGKDGRAEGVVVA